MAQNTALQIGNGHIGGAAGAQAGHVVAVGGHAAIQFEAQGSFALIDTSRLQSELLAASFRSFPVGQGHTERRPYQSVGSQIVIQNIERVGVSNTGLREGTELRFIIRFDEVRLGKYRFALQRESTQLRPLHGRHQTGLG